MPLGYGTADEPAPLSHDWRTIAEVYKREDGKYDWRLKSFKNGQIVATSGGQGFNHKDDATDAVMKLGEWADRIQEVKHV